MVERFYFYCTTENWGLHNRKLGFAQPKTGVCTTENWGLSNFKKLVFFILHNRKLGFFRYNITKNMLVGGKEKQKRV